MKSLLCSLGTGWITLRFASSCQAKETEKDCDTTLYMEKHLKLVTLKAYQNIYGKGNRLETG